jgi:Mismatch repair ATPase (MutS family)
LLRSQISEHQLSKFIHDLTQRYRQRRQTALTPPPQIKSQNFDKITLFKVGKFYEIFYYDAHIAQAVCGLKWMGSDTKPHVGFPEVALHQNATKLVKEGYVTIVVEQVETATAAAARISIRNLVQSGY